MQYHRFFLEKIRIAPNENSKIFHLIHLRWPYTITYDLFYKSKIFHIFLSVNIMPFCTVIFHHCYLSNKNENPLDYLIGSHFFDCNHKDLWVGDSFMITHLNLI